jgi:hypothetical protein
VASSFLNQDCQIVVVQGNDEPALISGGISTARIEQFLFFEGPASEDADLTPAR